MQCIPPYKRGSGSWCDCNCYCIHPDCYEEIILYYNCVPVTPTPTPTLGCDSVTSSGGPGVTINNHNVPSKEGEVTFTYDAFSIPDSFKVEANGTVYLDTGSISGSGSKTFCKPQGVTTIKVTVTGPEGTAWTYTLGCPTNPCPNTKNSCCVYGNSGGLSGDANAGDPLGGNSNPLLCIDLGPDGTSSDCSSYAQNYCSGCIGVFHEGVDCKSNATCGDPCSGQCCGPDTGECSGVTGPVCRNISKSDCNSIGGVFKGCGTGGCSSDEKCSVSVCGPSGSTGVCCFPVEWGDCYHCVNENGDPVNVPTNACFSPNKVEVDESGDSCVCENGERSEWKAECIGGYTASDCSGGDLTFLGEGTVVNQVCTWLPCNELFVRWDGCSTVAGASISNKTILSPTPTPTPIYSIKTMNTSECELRMTITTDGCCIEYDYNDIMYAVGNGDIQISISADNGDLKYCCEKFNINGITFYGNNISTYLLDGEEISIYPDDSCKCTKLENQTAKNNFKSQCNTEPLYMLNKKQYRIFRNLGNNTYEIIFK